MVRDSPRLAVPNQSRPGVGIVHLGLGAFFRAHGAIYIAEAMRRSGGEWGIIGVSLVRPLQRDLLAPQGYAYTAVELGPGSATPQVIDIIQNVLVAREDPAAVVAAMVNPSIRIVTLTVTEKGYCHDPSTGALNLNHPDIIHDVANESSPRSAPGFLVRALQRRRVANTEPFTVLCCDNLPDNGRVVRRVVLDLAQQIDSTLAEWIIQRGAFPNTMVDRIVPKTKPEDIEHVTTLTGKLDRSPVMHEPFRQWVIHDTFVANAHPDFAAVGVQMVADVRPFELMKLRCLNGTHSALAYLGYLAGHKTIYDTVTDPAYEQFVRHLWRHEIIPSLTPPVGTDLALYTDSLFKRYANPAIAHLTWQIAMDGSQKLPQRILSMLQDNLHGHHSVNGLILTVAAWMHYVGGIDESGQAIDVRDPMAERLRDLTDGAMDSAGKVDALLSVTEIFPPELVANVNFRQPLIGAFQALSDDGARACITRIGQ